MKSNNKKIGILMAGACAAVLILTGNPCTAASGLSYDDFAPPANGGPTKVEAAVEKKGNVYKAQTAQDGLNYVYKALMDKGTDSVEEIVVPSGMAFISVGSAGYSSYDNRNATLLSKRAAYTRALVKAKKQLVEQFEGLSTKCENAISESMVSLDSGSDQNQANKSTSTAENCRNVVKGMLRGHVTYAIDDRPEKKTVVVAIASSTKTRTADMHVGGAVLTTTDVRRMWDSTMAEIASGAVPPAGARMITNPHNGETIIVGFGSAIVRQNRDAGMARSLKEVAFKQAQMRADNSLVGFLKGDKVIWEGRFHEETSEKGQQFEFTPTGDVKVFDQTKHTFFNKIEQSDDYKVTTAGRLPPGVKKKAFIDQSGDWAIAISVYNRSMTARAKQAGSENRNGFPSQLPPPQDPGRMMIMDGGLNEGADNPKGPSGSVSKEPEL